MKFKVTAGATLVVIVLTLSGAAWMASKDHQGDARAKSTLTELERLAPLTTSQMVVTDGVGQDGQWWKTVVSFMPAIAQLDNLVATADLGIAHLGYSFSAANPALGLDQQYVRLVYVETGDAAHASAVQRWLSSGAGATAGAYTTAIKGNVVVLATSDIALPAELAQGRNGLGSTARYQQDTAKRESGSLIWEDWDAFVKAAGASSGKPAEYSSFFSSITGFRPGSRWVGYSTGPADGWAGGFRAGGIDPALVNVASVSAAIQSFSKVLARDPQGVPSVSDLGAGNYLRDSFYVKHPELSAPLRTMGTAGLVPKAQEGDATLFAFAPSAWLGGTSKTATAQPEGSSLFAYNIKGNQISLIVTATTVKPFASTTAAPIKTVGPPVGATPLPFRSAPDTLQELPSPTAIR